MHKAWQAFGVELDNFCERDTIPQNASISTTGMKSLITSKLYGKGGTFKKCTCDKSEGTHYGQGSCTDLTTSFICTGLSPAGSWTTGADIELKGPGKVNLIGFGAERCSNLSVTMARVRITENLSNGSAGITNEDQCTLDETSYKMAVVGHIAGDKFYGISINHDGVLSAGNEDSSANVDPNCS